MSARWVAVAAVAVLFASGCGDDGGAAPAPSSTTTSSTTPASSTTAAESPTTTGATTSTAPSTTTTAATTTTGAEDAAACPGSGALPDQAANNSLAAADTNGDGMPDTLHAYTIGDPSAPGAWWLQVSFAGGGGTTLQINDPGASVGGVRVYDGSDLNGDGRDEFFAKVGAGASVTLLGLFDVADCTLRRVTVDDQPTEFAVGASVNFVSGLDCFDADVNGANDFLIVYAGQRLGETPEFEVTATQYAVQDGSLGFILADGIGGNENDPDFARLSSAGCPGLANL